MSRIRVMTYNVHAGVGLDDKYELERIEEVIRDAGPDVVGLQEVDVHWGPRSSHENMIGRLAEALGMHAFYAPIYELPPAKTAAPPRQFGVALLSRHPIVQADNMPMTRLSSQDASPTPAPMPGLARVTVGIADTPITVYVAHLDYQLDPAVRKTQVAELLNDLESRADSPTLLLGDFNARPDAPELAPLFAALADTWAVRGAEPGFTYPSDFPHRKIDYILASSRFRVLTSTTIRSFASDHMPLVAELELV